MAATPTEQNHDPIFKTTDLAAEVRRIWGAEWNKPSTSYEFSGGRRFELRTEDAAIYITSRDFG
jgi:hypothetical protein